MSSDSEKIDRERLLQAVKSMFYDEVYQEAYKRKLPDDDLKRWEDEEYAANKHKEFLEELLGLYLKQFGYTGASDPKLRGFETIFITKLYASPGGVRNLDEYLRDISRSTSPQQQLRIVNEVLRLVKEDRDIGSIAAGALENLFVNHCDEIYNDLDQMIRSNPNMRIAIRGIWCRSEPKLFKKLEALLNKYGLK